MSKRDRGADETLEESVFSKPEAMINKGRAILEKREEQEERGKEKRNLLLDQGNGKR